jgi:hypothetical protein
MSAGAVQRFPDEQLTGLTRIAGIIAEHPGPQLNPHPEFEWHIESAAWKRCVHESGQNHANDCEAATLCRADT